MGGSEKVLLSSSSDQKVYQREMLSPFFAKN